MRPPKDAKEFQKMLEEKEIALGCVFCDASMWVEIIEGKPHLMRLGEVPVNQCPVCTEIHEMIE